MICESIFFCNCKGSPELLVVARVRRGGGLCNYVQCHMDSVPWTTVSSFSELVLIDHLLFPVLFYILLYLTYANDGIGDYREHLP